MVFLIKNLASLRLGRPNSAIKKLQNVMARLRAKRDDIRNQIGAAESEGKIPTNEVNQWLREVEELEGQMADLDQDFQSTSCFSCYYRCSINRRAAEKFDEANELMSRADTLNPIAIVQHSNPTAKLPLSNRPPIGIESYVEEIMGYINGGEDNIKANPIATVQHSKPAAKLPISNRPPIGIESYVEEIMGYINGGEDNIKANPIATVQHSKPAAKLPISNRPPIGIESYVEEIMGYINGGEGNIKANKLMSRADTLNPIATVQHSNPTAKLPLSNRPPIGIESYVEEIMGYINGGEDNIKANPIATVQHSKPAAKLPISNRPPVGIESYVEDIVGYIHGGTI